MDKLKAFVAKFWKAAGSIVLLVVAVGVIVSFWFIPRDYSVATGSAEPCSEPEVADTRTLLPVEGAPVPLILENTEGVLIEFWRDRGTHWRTVYLQAARKNPRKGQEGFAQLEPGSFLSVSERPLERQELSGVIGPGQYVTTAKVTGPKEVSLTVCVDSTGSEVDPGTYVGSVRIVGRGIQPVTVPVTVSLQYSGYRWIVPLLGVVTFIGGSFLVWASHKRASYTEETKGSIWRDIDDLPGWIANNYVGVAGGAIAAISVFIAKYWRNAPWGASAPEDWFALLGGMFTAYTTTLTAATALVTPRRKEQASANEASEGAEPEAAAPGAREVEGADHRRSRPQ
jgi:hypothetical protein